MTGLRTSFRLLGALAVLLALHVSAPDVAAQSFGKNKVQYRPFDWSVIRTEHFEVYFYGNERQTAVDAARMAERSYRRLSRALDHEIGHPVPVILYATHTDFQQSNVVNELIDEGVGGITEYYKQRVLLPFTGSYGELEHVLTHEMVHAFQMDMLYGDALGLVTNPFSFQLPLWVMEGMAEYLSTEGGVDAHTRMWLRDGALEGYLIPIPVLNNVRDIRVYRFGQSICDFIARHYGEEKLGEILRRAPEAKGLDEMLKGALGIDTERLSQLWTEEVRRRYLPEIANHQKPEDFATRLTRHEKDLSSLNLAPEVSPRGDRMVFISDRSLYQDIYLASTIDGVVLGRLVKGERSGDLESLRFLTTSLTWSPDEKEIAFAAKAGDHDVIYVLDVDRKKVVRRLRFPVDGLLSPSWSPDGERLAFVGLVGGQSDLFVCRRDGSDLQRLTQDRYMDRDPRWSPDGTCLAFTTDRGNETDFTTLHFGDSRVAIYHLADGRIDVLPRQEGMNLNPCWSGDGRWLAYLSDRTGISNIFATELETGDVYILTDVLSGITGLTAGSPALSWSSGGDRMVFCSYSQGGYDIFALKDPLALRKPYTPALAASDAAGGERAAETDWSAAPEGAPTPGAAGAVERGGGEDLAFAGPDSAGARADSAAAGPPRLAAGSPMVDLEEPPAQVDATLPDTSSFKVVPYRTRFTRDFSAGGAAFASNVGLAGETALSFSDILGNHNIYIAAGVYGSLEDSDLLVSYTNLSRRTNYGLALFQYRDDFYVYATEQGDAYQSRIYRGVELAFMRPFSKFARLEWGLQAAAVSESVYRAWYYGRAPDVETRGTRYFLSPSVGLVTDNVLFGYNGPLSGGRSRWQLEHSWGDISRTTAFVDWRRYYNIRQRYVFAVRGIGAASTGRDPEFFRVGGPYTYRGADWGDLIGTRLGIGNLEFRFPLIERLQFVWPLALDFRGIQGVLFWDTEATWTDDRSFHLWRDGHLGDVQAAYGFGARLNLGLFILRYDVAQATDLAQKVGGTRHFFTIGGDF